MKTYEIILGCDDAKAEKFAKWLRNKGHQARVGKKKCSYINGYSESRWDWAREIRNRLWDEYCEDN